MKYSQWGLMVVLVMLGGIGIGIGWSEGCLEEERLALFQLKPFFPFIDSKTIDGTGPERTFLAFLDFYDSEEVQVPEEKESSTDCCEWERIECNPTTGRVTHLFLDHSYDVVEDAGLVYTAYHAILTTERESWYLNASLFLPFEELQTLSLSGNTIAGCVDNQGFERLSFKLDQLEILDLSYNDFNDSILASLSELSSLKSLNLAGNAFTVSNPSKGIKMLSKLNHLETLDLSDHDYFGNDILSQLHDGFTSLKSLRLQDCGLKETVDLLEFHNLTNLKELYLGINEIESLGSLFHGRLRLNKLEVLDLSENHFGNGIFSSLGVLSNLKSLDLSNNKLEGSIHIKEKGGLELIKLEVLDLYNNLFNNDVFSFLGTLSNLKFLNLGANQLVGTINLKGATEIRRLKNLKVLDLRNNFFINDTLSSLDGLSNLEELYIDCISGCSLPLQSLGLFPSLKTLSLSGFSFNASTTSSHSHGHNTKWQIFTNLEELEIYSSSFPLNFIGVLSSLTKLYVSSCDINTSLFIQEWQNLTNLKELEIDSSSFPLNFIGTLSSLKRLYLSFSNITDSLFIQEGRNLRSLEELMLEDSSLPSKFIRAIGPLTSLRNLYWYNPYVDQSLSMHDLCESTNLQELSMGGNNLRGSLPMCFSNLTSLEILDLSYNELSGNISVLKSLASLRWLDLSSNNFQIPSSLGPLFNLSKLKYIRADNNIIYADDEMHPLAPRFQLNYISLSCCGRGGLFPQFLHHQRDLRSLTLSHISFKGNQFPSWLLENNHKLQLLELVNSSLSGPFQLLPLSSHSGLSALDISNNFFIGNIPIQIGAHLPLLTTLNMSKNYFNGSIPSSFGDMISLESLDLSNNLLSGGIPEHLAMGCSSLSFLALSNNTLQGAIFSGNFSLTRLSTLKLDGNYFSGMIPNVLSNCSYLHELDLSNNNLFGRIPSWIEGMPTFSTFAVSRNRLFGRIPQRMGNASNLEQIAMAGNHLEGSIPRSFCNLNLRLQFLDLSLNNFSGTLPSCFRPTSIEEVHLSRNMLQGPFPNAFRDSPQLMTLDLSYNHFGGHIPNWIGNLSELSYLLLKRNHFEGEIPIQLCKLDHLSLIDLSQNNLSGRIPSCLKVVTLKYVAGKYSWFLYNYMGSNSSVSMEEPIEYTIKNRPDTYKKTILQYMSGIDLSCNNLTGEIPHERDNILMLYTLNLSHNSLTGPIPRAFSSLVKLESLDLSYNHLTGNVPPEFAMLHFLGYFNVSYNNLSGKTPERIGQLGAFDESSYVGNPYLCGSLVGKNCSPPATPLIPKASTEEHGFIDMDAFYASFIACYIVVILCIAAVLYINPYWRQAWFYHVQTTANSCYYFVIDNLVPRKFRY